MKQLATWVAGAVVGTLVGSCAIGVAVTELGGRDAVTIGRDIAIFVIALMTWIAALIGFALWFGLAAGTHAATGPLVRGMRRVADKARSTDEAVARGLERFVVRPVAIGVGHAAAVATGRRRAVESFRALRDSTRRVARDAFDTVAAAAASLRPRGKVTVRTGVPAPPDVP